MKKKTASLILVILFIFTLSAHVSAADLEDVWVVKVKPTANQGQVSRLMGANEEELSALDCYIVDRETAEAMSKSGQTEWIEQTGQSYLLAAPNDAYYSEQWALADLNWEYARLYTKGDTSVTVAIIDDGFHYNHEDAGNIVAGYDFTDGKRTPDGAPDGTHGTHIAGIIGAATNNYRGIAGATEDCGIAIYHTFVYDPIEKAPTANNAYVANAIVSAVNDGADIINMSFGSKDNDSVMAEAIRYAASKGVILVAAAGNKGTTAYEYPAAYSDVIGVGAHDSDKIVSSYSQRNDSVFVSAPGDNVLSLGQGPNQYAYMYGTSMATPYVTSLAALALSYDNQLTPSAFRNLLQTTSRDLGNPGYDTEYGWGAVDYYACLAKLAGVDLMVDSVAIAPQVAADIIIPGTVYATDDIKRTLSVILSNVHGDAIDVPHTIDWELPDGEKAGVTISGDVLTVTKDANPQTLRLRATVTDDFGESFSHLVNIVLKKESWLGSASLTQSSFALPTINSSFATHTLSFTGTDQYGQTITRQDNLQWGLADHTRIGLDIDEKTGRLTIYPNAYLNKRATITLKAEYVGHTSEFSLPITLTTAESQWTPTILGYDYVTPGQQCTYEFFETDQYGNARAREGASWSIIEHDDANVSINASTGILTVAQNAAPQIILIQAQKGEQSATLKVEIVPTLPQSTPIKLMGGWGTFTLNNKTATLALDSSITVARLARDDGYATLDLSFLDVEKFELNIPGDSFNAIKQASTNWGIRTNLGTLTLPTTIANDLLKTAGSYPASQQTMVSIAKKSVSYQGNRQGTTLVGEGLDIALTIDGTTPLGTTSSLMTLNLSVPQSTSYTSIVRVDENGEITSVPTNRNLGDAKASFKEFGTLIASNRSISFSDIGGEYWAYDTIYNMAARFVIDGTTHTTFQPEGNITRAQFSTMVVRALGISPIQNESRFEDTEQDAWYTPYITAAYDNGLIQGTGNSLFSPEASVTREQAIMILTRAFAYADIEIEALKDSQVTTILNQFADAGAINGWARYEVAQGVESGIASGYQDNTLRPLLVMTRAEGATMIQNLLRSTQLIE